MRLVLTKNDRLMDSANSLSTQKMQQLREVRLSILRLHKALLHFERDVYEEYHGRIRSPGEFFRLVTEDEWFNWLRPISQLIVQMDDVIHAKEPVTVDQVDALMTAAKHLLQPAAQGTTLKERYYQAIQRDADIASMHGEVTTLLNPKE